MWGPHVRRTSINNFTIWENAVALEEAYVQYAHKEDADRYRSLSAENSLTAMIERAEKNITLESIEKIATALDIKISDFF